MSEASSSVGAARRVSDLPLEERPRERLSRLGAQALSNRELLAVVLGAGTRAASALDVAETLLNDGLRELSQRSTDALARAHGLGLAKATRLLAALELGARVAAAPSEPLPVLKTPADVARHLMPRHASRPVEAFGLLALDVRHRLKREALVSVGCLTQSLVHPREVFQEAIVARAAAIVIFHNHPSGDPEPSADDVALTRRLVSAGSLLGIEVLDHLILGAGRYVSLKERGAL